MILLAGFEAKSRLAGKDGPDFKWQFFERQVFERQAFERRRVTD